jgi:hypothetical protein
MNPLQYIWFLDQRSNTRASHVIRLDKASEIDGTVPKHRSSTHRAASKGVR